MVILQSINYPLADNLTTIGQQWKRATTMTIGLVVAIIGYIVLGSKYGMIKRLPQPSLPKLHY